MSRSYPQFHFRIEPSLLEWLIEKAGAERLSRTWLVNQAIREMREREQKQAS